MTTCKLDRLDSSGNIYLAGDTKAINFPTVQAYQNAHPNTVRSHVRHEVGPLPRQNVLFSTYLGETIAIWRSSIAVDSTGNVFVAGSTRSARLSSYTLAPCSFQTMVRLYLSYGRHISPYGVDAPQDLHLAFSAVYRRVNGR